MRVVSLGGAPAGRFGLVEFQQFYGKGRPSGPTAFAFAIAFIAVTTSSSVGSVPRALATGCCGSLFGMSGSRMMSDFVDK